MKHDNCKEGGFLTDPEIENYAEMHTSPESDLLHDLNRQTNLQVLMPRMLSGHLQGAFLAMLVKMIKPSLIYEIGTFTGYATLAMAEAMPENCRITTIEKNRENAALAEEFFEKGGYEEKIELLVGDAMDFIENLQFGSELVFIDADKRNNKKYYELILPKVKPGGFLLIDNVLWDGKVLDEKPDKDTQAIIDFNVHVQNDSRVENVLLPFRDGILLVRKK